MPREKETTVVLMKIPDGIGRPLRNAERAKQIAAGSEKVRSEKYWVFRLLEEAAEQLWDAPVDQAHRSACGRWEASGISFSLSHSGPYVAVALGRETVGVDVQSLAVHPSERLIARSLNGAEAALIAGLDGEERKRAFLRIFSCKESLFKTRGEPVFHPEIIDSTAGGVSEIAAFGLSDALVTLAHEGGAILCYRAESENDRIILKKID